MEKKYTLTVNNKSNNYGSICVYQTAPDQPDHMVNLAWFSKAAHPGTIAEFDWNTNYNFAWSNQGTLKPRITFQTSQVTEEDNDANCYASSPRNVTMQAEYLSEEECIEAAVKPEANRMEHIQPKYYVAFGDFKEGDSIDVTMLENAVELELSEEGTTIVIDKDNSIRLE